MKYLNHIKTAIQIIFLLCCSIGTVAAGHAAEPTAVPRDSNFNNTESYDSTRVEAQLVVPVEKDTRVIHFIRDNNDPRVVSKTYVLKHVDPYEFRDYLRQMVQSKRVGNTALQQEYPGNSSSPATAATVSQPILTEPLNAQPGYQPIAQLGSNTAVECLKYVDGTGLLIVSAEEYRFKDYENGMGIDSLVAMLDNPDMGSLSTGYQMYFYLPKFVPARNLMPLIENVGMNINDVTELWQGMDIVAYDPDLNWLIFDVCNYSCENIASLLAQYDVPVPQVRLKITVYEIYDENDDKIGLDFQNWKNNAGVDFFSIGGRYRNNWAASYNLGGLGKGYGSERTSFFNFNPKWNTRYLDFLFSQGKAKVVHQGELCIRNNTPAQFSRTTQVFYFDDSQPAAGSVTSPDLGTGAYQLLSDIVGEIFPVGTDELPVGKGNQQISTVSAGYGFDMNIQNVSVNLSETRFEVSLQNSSLIGFESSGKPRISRGNTVKQVVSLPHGKDSFVIGGLKKQELVRSENGIPWLCKIPLLGYLFSSKTDSIKHSELLVVAECQWDSPAESAAVAHTVKQNHP